MDDIHVAQVQGGFVATLFQGKVAPCWVVNRPRTLARRGGFPPSGSAQNGDFERRIVRWILEQTRGGP